MTEAEIKQRQIALASSGGVCEVCQKPLSKMQGAHRIANTKTNRAKWGNWIIDHPMNIAIVCSLECNHLCNIGFNPVILISFLAFRNYFRNALFSTLLHSFLRDVTQFAAQIA